MDNHAKSSRPQFISCETNATSIVILWSFEEHKEHQLSRKGHWIKIQTNLIKSNLVAYSKLALQLYLLYMFVHLFIFHDYFSIFFFFLQPNKFCILCVILAIHQSKHIAHSGDKCNFFFISVLDWFANVSVCIKLFLIPLNTLCSLRSASRYLPYFCIF